jgi:hypothetical protein
VLVNDEAHHHRVLKAIAMELRAIACTGSRETTLPPRGGPDQRAIESLRGLAIKERVGVRELGTLADPAPELLGSLFSLPLELIALDSENTSSTCGM